VVPGSDTAEQFDKMFDGCKQYVSGQSHLAPALKSLNKMKRETEDDFLPTKPDPKLYSMEVEVQALDEQARAMKNAEGDIIMIKKWIVHKPQDEKQAWNDYNNDHKTGKAEFKRYELAEQSLLVLFKNQFSDCIWSEITHYKDFDTHWEDSNLIECIKIMKLVCGSSCEESLRFKPAEVIKMTAAHLNVRQEKNESCDEFAKRIKKRSETLSLVSSPFFAGYGVVSHFINEDGLKLEDLYDPDKIDTAARKVYGDKAMDLTNSILFMRGCKCNPDKKMFKGLESEYAHGNKEAYPLTLYGMLKLYRKEYMPQPKKKNNVPNK